MMKQQGKIEGGIIAMIDNSMFKTLLLRQYAHVSD